MKLNLTSRISLMVALAVSAACEPNDAPCGPPELETSVSASLATSSEPTVAQTCDANHLHHGDCDVEKMWPQCRETKLPDSGGKGPSGKRCTIEFKKIRELSAADLKYPLCDVTCQNSYDDDTRRCDDPGRCTGLPACTHPGEKKCCVGEQDQNELDRQYLEFAWRLFIAMNLPLPGNEQSDWLSWSSPFAVSAEAESATPVDAAAANPSTRRAHSCANQKVPATFLTVPWYETGKVQPDRPPRSNPVRYRADDGLQNVQFQVLTNPESDKAHQNIVTDGCAQALRAASSHKLPVARWWQQDFEDGAGPVHVKAAWVDVAEQDCNTEFICVARTGARARGLVALHVVAKNNHSENFWTWATFEHVRAVDADGALSALFSDEDDRESENKSKPNQCPDEPDSPTRIARVQLDYPGAPDYRKLLDEINTAARETLRREATEDARLGVLARYRLAGVQRPRTEPSGNVVPWPPKLSNVVIEWDRQDSSCMGCHSRALSWRLCEPGESDCKNCSTGCPTVKRDWVPQRPAQAVKLPQSDMFWGYARARGYGSIE